jgi:beta-glucosidase
MVKISQRLSRMKIPAFFIVIVLGFFATLINTDMFDKKPITAMPPVDALYLDGTQPIEARVADLLSYMTLEEKIGQMTLIEKNSVLSPSDIAEYHLGGLLSGAGSKPLDNTAAGWRKMTLEYQVEARQSRLGIPLLYGADAVHGHAHVPNATIFPHAIGLGAANNEELVKAIAEATAKELDATGVNWSFSPNLDQPQDIRWGRVYEAFSDNPEIVSKLGVAYLNGLQVSPHSENIFVLATPKHYLGLGGMGWGTSLNQNFKIDQGVTPLDETLLRTVYLPPFKEAVDAGALSMMVGLNTWGDKRSAFQKELLTTLLKEELGYKGFLVSDWYGVHEGRKNRFWATTEAVNAGVDMVMLPFDYVEFSKHMKWANRLGLISDARIDDAVGRILYAKFALGLFDEKNVTSLSEVANPTHRALARTAVSESLVLLKNEDNVLPISANTRHIRVAGSAADNIGKQVGAWSIEWQGIDKDWPAHGTSLLEGIKKRAGSGTTVEYDLLGNFDKEKKTPLGIAIVGEKPYAEGWGDTAYPILGEEDILAIKNLQESCDKVVVVIVSGRPLLIKNEVDSFDALVAAWLPGSEGGGVADVLFGDASFSGTLPLPWPSHAEQLPITTEGDTADGTPVLFPRAFGLTY